MTVRIAGSYSSRGFLSDVRGWSQALRRLVTLDGRGFPRPAAVELSDLRRALDALGAVTSSGATDPAASWPEPGSGARVLPSPTNGDGPYPSQRSCSDASKRRLGTP